jgi:hypothetical protein
MAGEAATSVENGEDLEKTDCEIITERPAETRRIQQKRLITKTLVAGEPVSRKVPSNQQTHTVNIVSFGSQNRFCVTVMAQFPCVYSRAQFREKRVGHHRGQLLVHCCRMLGSVTVAEDAVQGTLLRAGRYRDSVKEGAPLRP